MPPPSAGSGTTLEAAMPATSSGTATTNPARGPATAMSKSARACGIGSRSRMNAPSVPVSGSGAGRNHGNDASTS